MGIFSVGKEILVANVMQAVDGQNTDCVCGVFGGEAKSCKQSVWLLSNSSSLIMLFFSE